MAERNKTRAKEPGDQVICLTNMHVVRLLVACMVGAYILFSIGYFNGKQNAQQRPSIPSHNATVSNTTPVQTLALHFDHENDARILAERLQQEGLDAHLQRQISISAQGDEVYWYQIITKNFTNQEELVKLVERIRCQEIFVGNVALSEC
jgi:hypothetical protein